MEDIPFDWYFSEEDIKVYGGTKIHPKDLLRCKEKLYSSEDTLRDFQEARVRYVPTEIETLRGKGNAKQFSILYSIFNLL